MKHIGCPGQKPLNCCVRVCVNCFYEWHVVLTLSLCVAVYEIQPQLYEKV